MNSWDPRTVWKVAPLDLRGQLYLNMYIKLEELLELEWLGA